jgi:hypothetical protein
MYDIHIRMEDSPGSLARFGAAMGECGVSLEGGGVFTFEGQGHAHFLVRNGERARAAAERAGLDVVAVREVVVRQLKQDELGELAAIAAALAGAGVNIITQYSDHQNRLILVVDNPSKAAAVTAQWAA